MSFLSKLRHLLPWRRRSAEEDMREELDSLAALAEVEGGRRSELGNLTRVAEEARVVWTWLWLEQALTDVRYAARTMKQHP